MAQELFTINCAPCAVLLFLHLFLLQNTSLAHEVKVKFYALLILEAVELLAYNLELWTATFAALSPLRVALSAIGYSLRPAMLYPILLLTLRNLPGKRYRLWLALPLAFNALLAFSALFTDIVYAYTPDNHFVRGPLGYVPHIVLAVYLLCLVACSVRLYRGKRRFEALLLGLICAFLLLCVVAEAALGFRSIGRTAIALCTVFYYMFFQSQSYREAMDEERRMLLDLERETKLDSMTRLLNKKAFMAEMQRALHAPGVENATCLFLDLDHFKEVNDRLGHAAGDLAICDTADKLRRIFRKVDYIGRFGGDEFCVFLQNLPLDQLSARLKDVIAAFDTRYSVKEQTVSISASIGAGCCGADKPDDFRQLLELADEALYEAKISGRNQYVIKRYSPRKLKKQEEKTP